MPDRILTDDDCARIVAASIEPDRVLGGIEGHDGGAPDVLLATVERIVAEHLVRTESDTRTVATANVDALRRAEVERDRLREGIRALADEVGGLESDYAWIFARLADIEEVTV